MDKNNDLIQKVGKFRELNLISHATIIQGNGYSYEDLKKPIIGIANSFNDLIPGHKNLREIAQQIKNGIYAAGGIPAEFGCISVCDALSDNHIGSKYTLPSRDLIADSVELQVRAHAYDGLVILGSCDKIVPGMIMGALRTNIPTIFVNGGPMISSPSFGNKVKTNTTTISEGLGMYYGGKLNKDELVNLSTNCALTCGSCQFLGTANTMCTLAEAMGLCLPGSSLIPAVYNERSRSAFNSGEKIVELVKKNINIKKIVNLEALKNAIAVLMATGGSTNAIIHLSAIANEIGISSDTMINLYERYFEKVPLIVKVNPASDEFDVQDFYYNGGIPEVMKRLGDNINLDTLTCTGETVDNNLKYVQPVTVNDKVIRTLDNPFLKFGGVTIMRGNIAPETGVAKPAAIHKSAQLFKGRAVCFDREEAAIEAVKNKKIKDGDVLVIRYEGPKGGPGMREMYLTLKLLNGEGLSKTTAVITDGRFSGTNNGCFVGHISPEAAAGGPIGLLRDGDEITIDINKKEVNANVSKEEFARRKAQIKPYKSPDLLPGMMKRYVDNVSSAIQGAILYKNY
ncbi:dihydroxy-acid dehydratase [Peptoniphilus sp.]|jgi:dihydroxy-acid dehydratase|uniref:dihydroxy-acid dehydratase n=1 Tax=Peptoniphilus sp. TaxID=1971214 RepID=UPI003D8A6A2C